MIKGRIDSIKAINQREQEAAQVAAIASQAFVALVESGQIDSDTAAKHLDQLKEWGHSTPTLEAKIASEGKTTTK